MEHVMDFGEALLSLRYGRKVARQGWNGKGMWIYLVIGSGGTVDGKHVSLEPFIVMKTADDKLVPWLASQTDVLAQDWVEVN